MKVYNPGDIADLLKLKVSTIRKYSIMLEELGYTFEKNNRNQRYYTDADIITLRKLVTFKDNGMTLGESAEAVILWHNGNESEQEGITPYQTDTHNDTKPHNDDIMELKSMIHKQNELIEGLTKRLDEQQEYIDQRLEERDKALMQSINESLETRKQIAAENNKENNKGFFHKLFKRGSKGSSS
ncbi:MerR family transcriptional regulator [Lentibacillus cibarius]|nr:MerR family transcriptional regulator [Lentibacillus cibarius]